MLQLVPDFNYVDGRSYYVYVLSKYLHLAGVNVIFCSNGGDSIERIKRLEIPVYLYENLAKKTFLPKSTRFLKEIISKNHIDIIHSHHRYLELLANLVSKGKKVNTVTTALSLVSRRYGVEYKSKKIIAVSKAVQNMLVNKFGVNSSKISLIPNFVDSEEASDKEVSAKRNSGKINLLSIGRFHREKNFETLIGAVSLIKDFRIRLVLVGEGNEELKYRELIKKKLIDAEILPPARDLKRFFHSADICVLSSRRDPMPTFMLQSGLFKRPFIGSDIDGIAELIEHGGNGLLFRCGDEEDLAQKIRMFAENKSMADKCAAELNKSVLMRFTERAVVPEILKLYMSFK